MHWDGHQTAFVAAGDKTARGRAQAGFQADAAGLPVGDPGRCAGRRARRRPVRRFHHRRRRLDRRRQRPLAGPSGQAADRRRRRAGRRAEPGHFGRQGAERPHGRQALARFDRDVLGQPHADTVVLMMGINDIGWPGCGLGAARPGSRRRTTSSPATAADRARPCRRHAHHRRDADAVRRCLRRLAVRGLLHGRRRRRFASR